MRLLRKVFKVTGILLAVLVLVLIVFVVYVYNVSDLPEPKISDTAALSLHVQPVDDSMATIGDNWIRKNEYGLYEMYVSGKPFERGAIEGKLSQNLVVEQEVAFTDEIRRMIPSKSYLKFLKYIIGFINKDLPEHVSDEYKQEIFGISASASHQFDWIGDNYDRILNYHAAHDIGHALQNMMLVGCTSFGAWGGKTEDGSMLIGRNFDFWVGDKFAENKIVSFVRPDSGFAFASVTWGGFTGVVSGMNDQGLTVTINAAKSSIPFGAATPVSLVAREVLQYASTIDEAVRIARSRKMFVSESFLVSSAKDHKAVVIEKTPDELAVYDPQQDYIQCTNHYQSRHFEKQSLNVEQKQNSASVYRYRRLQELMQQHYPLTPQKIADILRDRKGLQNSTIGNGNEKAVNQLIAHHSIIFQPDSLRFWVSTSPWQLGVYVCYDLRHIMQLNGLKKDTSIAHNALNIPADSFLGSAEFTDFLRFRKNKMALLLHQEVDTAQTVKSNPMFYDAYRIAGDFSMQQQSYRQAIIYYRHALRLEVATIEERKSMEKKIALCEKIITDLN
ncbi:MAG TPA: C45 family peptidase [Flavipsychrobacter sp.]|nr:C45 family peptidase [Flavipsychrobacter sp.]